jgi:hypothetical protein
MAKRPRVEDPQNAEVIDSSRVVVYGLGEIQPGEIAIEPLYARVEVIVVPRSRSAGKRILLTINDDAPQRYFPSITDELCAVELPIEFAEEIASALENATYAVRESEGAFIEIESEGA